MNQIEASANPDKDPSTLFWMIAERPQLIALLLAGARATPGRKRGVHLGNPLFTQWPIASGNGLELRLHCFHRDDPDACHNHAWEWSSLILEGGYWDIGADGGMQWREPGELLREDGSRFHKIALRDGREAWSLFLRGPDIREWGFAGPGGNVIPRADYVSVLASAQRGTP